MSARRRLIAAAALLAGAAPVAAQTIDPVYADHSVIQRDHPVRISGTAAPGEKVRISLAGQMRETLGDVLGRWTVELPALSAGGPHQLEARFERGTLLTANDLLVGDVWLCSGQSNMEWPVSRSLNPEVELGSGNDPQLRLLTIAKRTAMAPSAGFAEPPEWKVADRESVGPFSAACYFMGRELRKSERVPIGLINASWGGTAARSWIDPRGAALASPGDAALLDLYRHDPPAAARGFGETWQAWWSAQHATRPWADPGQIQWGPMKVGLWEQWGDPAFADFNGMVWARSTVTLTPAQAAQAATLSLGIIDEIDQSWVNGVPVGNTFGWDVERTYVVPAGTLRAGENEILVNILDSYGGGGFQGPGDKLAMRLADGTTKPLAPRLEYSIVQQRSGDPPRPPWDSAAGLSLIYNGMIAPLGRVGLKGVAWYQGESDAGMAEGYAERLRALIGGWRRQFGSPDLPFLIVGLPGWGGAHVAPVESGWAEVRDAQRRVGTSVPDAAFVPAIDLGDRLELHPPQKQAVGERLARAARALAYGAPHPASGPQIATARRDGDAVLLTFQGATGTLRSWSGAPVGFELCGPLDGTCRFARAVIDNGRIRVADDGRPFTRVRYAWADAPITNIFDAVPLPLSTFEIAVD